MLFFILNMYCSSDTLIQPHVLWFPRTPRHVGSTQTLLCLQTPFILEQMTILNTRRRQPCFGTDSVIKATFECIGARKPKWAYYWSRIKTFPSSYLDEVQGSWRRLLPTNQCNNKRLRRPFQLCLHKTNAGQGRRAKKKPTHVWSPAMAKVPPWMQSPDVNVHEKKRNANEAWLVWVHRRVGGQRLPDGTLANSSQPLINKHHSQWQRGPALRQDSSQNLANSGAASIAKMAARHWAQTGNSTERVQNPIFPIEWRRTTLLKAWGRAANTFGGLKIDRETVCVFPLIL